MHDLPTRLGTHRWPRSAGVLSVAGGLLVLAAGGFAPDLLLSLQPALVSMKANAALAFIALGICLVCLDTDRPTRWRRMLCAACAALVAATGVLSLVEHLTGTDLGIDYTLIIEGTDRVDTATNTAMPPASAFNLSLLGFALLLHARSAPSMRASVSRLNLAAAAVTLLAFVGYFYGIGTAHRVPVFASIALHSVLLFFVVCSGVVLLPGSPMRRALQSGSPGGLLARRLLPVALFMPPFLGWLAVMAVHAKLFTPPFAAAVFVTMIVCWFAALVLRLGRPLNRLAAKARRDAQALRLSERRLELAIELAGIGRYEWSLGSDRVDVTPQVNVMWGLEAEAGKSIELRALLDAIHEQDRAPFQYGINDLIRARGQVHEAEFRVLGISDGQERWIASRARLLYSGGAPDRYLGTAIDITRRKQAEQQILQNEAQSRQLAERLMEDDRRKNEFLAVLAHELRNPLAPLRSSVDLLRLRPDAPAPNRLLEVMDRQMQHLIRLVDDLVEVSRVTRGTIELRPEVLNLADVIRNSIETSRPLIEAAGLRLTVRLPGERLQLRGDAVRLAQIVSNLLNNAARYTDPGGQIVLAGARAGENEIAISVRDTGIGIAPEMLPKVFDLFVQIDGGHRGRDGLGIGLTLVRTLVEMHGGRVEAHSEGAGLGAEFVVTLPGAILDASDAGEHADVAPMQTREGTRVLVVDDNRDAAQSLGLILETLGAEVAVTYDGRTALSVLKAHRPAIAFIDLDMPGMDGHELARRIRQGGQCPDIRLIALTGWAMSGRGTEGVDDFDTKLTKPAGLDTLREVLGRESISA